MRIRSTAKTHFLLVLILLFSCLLQAVSSPSSQTAGFDAYEPLRIDAYTSVKNLVKIPRPAYPKQARRLHIDGTVELELTVSPQGKVISERVISGPPELQQATIKAFKKVKYKPFLRDGKPSVALVQAIIAYESARQSAYELNSAPLRTDNVPIPAIRGREVGHVEVLTDTQGVDFGLYLQRVLHDVKQNWYAAIPESAQMKHGNVILEFSITKYGKVEGMRLVAASGDVALDRAAWAGITGSDPFLPLPSEFGGPYLTLRFRFFYNPSKGDLK